MSKFLRKVVQGQLLKSLNRSSQKLKIEFYSTKGEDEEIKEYLKIEKKDNITLIGINRPEVRNCVNAATATQLTNAIAEFEEDETSNVGVLYGIGGSFCAGYDLSELSNNEKEKMPTMIAKSEGSIGPTRLRLKKPIIAAIDGYCVAGGLELALMCDLRVMEENAIMGVFNRRFGVPLIDGGTARLPALIGLSRALDLVLTGRHVSAQEALNFGLVNRVVSTGAGLGQALNLAASIAKFPAEGLKHDRDCLFYSAYDAKNFNDAVSNEVLTCSKELLEEAIFGASSFVKGLGKHGKFHDLKGRDLPDWELDELAREKFRPT